MADDQLAFDWKCHPEAENLLLSFLADLKQKSSAIVDLEERLQKETSTRLFDWLDQIIMAQSDALIESLLAVGFEVESGAADYRVFKHPGAQLPAVVLKDQPQGTGGIAVKVEFIEDFLMVRGLSARIEGSPYSAYRRCCVTAEGDISLWVIERRGTRKMEPEYNVPAYLEKYLSAREQWATRARQLDDEEDAMGRTLDLAQRLTTVLSPDLVAWIVLDVERDYWQAHNHAGQIQKNRQDSLGMGWANHDHHTFRSSRRRFASLVRLFELLGFHCRERYYAGDQAGWGAQVMENSRAGLVLFLDVDLAPSELGVDFAHQPLSERNELGTIGLWCSLHGDSILSAGMHHLEAQFQFDELKEDLSKLNVGMMEPFSSFSYLRQAFTKGERWSVSPKRIKVLLDNKLITKEQADEFLRSGAIGSHMENLQRREGYKGFNQKNVSLIIKKTDPRTMQATGF